MPTTVFQGLLLFVVLEASVFMNYKAKAQLFLRIKASEQQSEQLTDLLDTVPDSVYICSKSKPESSDKERVAQYSNL